MLRRVLRRSVRRPVASPELVDHGFHAAPPPAPPGARLARVTLRSVVRPATTRPRTLLDASTGTVFTLGDNAYPERVGDRLRELLQPDRGADIRRERCQRQATTSTTPRMPPGTSATSAARRAIPTKGYYSYDLGAWHIVVLNSNSACSDDQLFSHVRAGPVARGGPRREHEVVHARVLAPSAVQLRRRAREPSLNVAPFWDALYAAGADDRSERPRARVRAIRAADA